MTERVEAALELIGESLARQAATMERNALISEMVFKMNVEADARARAAFESDEQVKRTVQAEQKRRAEAAERAEAREDERIRLAQEFERLTAAAEDRSAEKHELMKVLAHLSPPDHIPADMFQTVPPDDPHEGEAT